jgi:GNAT superfamily N-acetyltransferase
MNPTIRPATENDVPQIMGLIHELALFEKAPEEVINTAEQMKKDGFEANPLFKCLVAETDAGIIGFALYYYRYSTWKGKCLYLEDFYVKENFRNFGVGKLLFDIIIETAKHDNCKRINWQVLDWNESAIKFYEKYNAGFDKEWWNGFLEL